MLATEATLDTVSRPSLPTCPMATLPLATMLLTPLVLVTSPRGRLRLMPTTDLTATADSVLTAMEATVLVTELFSPLAPLPSLEPTPPLPPPPPSPFAATAPPPPATTGPTLLEQSTLPRGPLTLTTAMATDLDTAMLDPSPPEFPPCLLLASPCRATLRATATATITNRHNCSSRHRLLLPQW